MQLRSSTLYSEADCKKEWLVVLKPHLGQKSVLLAGNNSLILG